MRNLYQIYLISDSTGETLDRIFLALKAQFPNFEYETNHFSFTRTESQTLAIPVSYTHLTLPTKRIV